MLQRIEDSSKVESPVMRNDKAIEDFATRLIYKEMARFSQQFNQNLETPGCFVELSSPSISEAKKKNNWNLNVLLAPHHVRPPVSVRQDPTLF